MCKAWRKGIIHNYRHLILCKPLFENLLNECFMRMYKHMLVCLCVRTCVYVCVCVCVCVYEWACVIVFCGKCAWLEGVHVLCVCMCMCVCKPICVLYM